MIFFRPPLLLYRSGWRLIVADWRKKQSIAWFPLAKPSYCLFELFWINFFNKCYFLFIINVQETYSCKLNYLNQWNYFTVLCQPSMSYFTRNYCDFWIKHFLQAIALQKVAISMNFLGIFIHFRFGGGLNLKCSDGEKIGKINPKFLKCKIGIENV